MVSKTLMACAVTAALGAFSSGAMAQVFPDFTVNENSVPGTSGTPLISADKITGNYVEVITFSGTNFNVSLKWNAGQFVGNNGSDPQPSNLSPTGSTIANQYGLYALYQGSGTFTTNANGTTTFNFAQGGNFNLFLDPNSNTTFTQPGSGSTAWGTAGSGDDVRIATGTPTSGQGTLDPSLPTCPNASNGGAAGINCGSFGATSSFSLVQGAGTNYFTSPSPFYNVSFQSGQLNNFPTTGTQLVNGSLDVVFNRAEVPEPASVALVGLGLMGLGLSRRRSKKA
jgi:hypothetical protein